MRAKTFQVLIASMILGSCGSTDLVQCRINDWDRIVYKRTFAFETTSEVRNFSEQSLEKLRNLDYDAGSSDDPHHEGPIRSMDQASGEIYHNYRVLACSSKTMVWIENSNYPLEVLVTISTVGNKPDERARSTIEYFEDYRTVGNFATEPKAVKRQPRQSRVQ